MKVKIIGLSLFIIIFTILDFQVLAHQMGRMAKPFLSYTAIQDTLPLKRDTATVAYKDTLPVKKDSTAKEKTPAAPDTSLKKTMDGTVRSLLPSAPKSIPAEPDKPTILVVPPDTAKKQDSTLKNITRDSMELLYPLINTNKVTNRILAANTMINTTDAGLYYIQETRDIRGKEFIFYILCGLLLILGLFKTFFSMYFNNLFRIFFNTSLRQSQLTDQLSQARLPSFILNVFFNLSAGIYIWLLFTQFNRVQSVSPPVLLLLCIACVGGIYLIKYLLLKFLGWLAGIGSAVDNYIFIIFLVNKITGILLIPFLLMLAFSLQKWLSSIVVISAMFLGLLFVSRYAKSYGAIDKKFPVAPFHLFIFVAGAEIIPLFIFYKIAVDYLI